MADNWNEIRFFYEKTDSLKPAVMVSACLLGEAVRYDGGDKYHCWVGFLEEHLTLTSCCPEAETGLGIPRPPVQLVDTGHGLIARGRDDRNLDVTVALEQFAEQSSTSHNKLCGYLFKSRSPSCGVQSTPLFSHDGKQIDTTSGIQAQAFIDRKPWLAYRQETDLDSEQRCRGFIQECKLVAEAMRCSKEQQQDFLSHYQQQGVTTKKLQQLSLLWGK